MDADWFQFREWESDVNRASTLGASLLTYMERPSPSAHLNHLLDQIGACVYLVPEGRDLDDSDLAEVLLLARNGNGEAGGRLGKYYLDKIRGDRRDEKVYYSVLLGAFLLERGQIAAALKILGEAIAPLQQLPIPRLIEMEIVLWCLSMHCLTRISKNDIQPLVFLFVMQVNTLVEKLFSIEKDPARGEESQLAGIGRVMANILFAAAGIIASSSTEQDASDLSGVLRRSAQDVERLTMKRWPVQPWLRVVMGPT